MSIIVKPNTSMTIKGTPNTVVANAPQKVLFLGQQLDDTSTNEVLVTDVGNTNAQIDSLFGEKSPLASALRAFRLLNTVTRVDAIPFNAAVGDPATATIDIAGTAIESSTLIVTVQSRTSFNFSISVAVGDGPDEIGAAIVSAVNEATYVLSTAAYVNPTVTLTASFDGEDGNSIGVEIEENTIPNGVTFTLTGFNGGTSTPVVTSAILAQCDNIRYQTVVISAIWDQTDLLSYMNDRYNDATQIMDGVVIVSNTDTSANLQTDSDTLNSPSYLYLGNKPVAVTDEYAGSALFEFDLNIAAQTAAIRALRFSSGQNLSGLLTNGANSSYNTGGPWLAAVPYQNTPFSNLPVIENQYGWTKSEQTSLNNNGVSFLGNNPNVNGIIAGTFVTTYQDVDQPWKYLNTVDTASQIREFFFNNNQQYYQQATLTQGQIIPGSRQVNPETFAAYQLSLYVVLSNFPYMLCPNGQTYNTFFKDNLIVTFDYAAGAISFFAIVPIVSQIRTINGVLQISFDISTVNGGS